MAEFFNYDKDIYQWDYGVVIGIDSTGTDFSSSSKVHVTYKNYISKKWETLSLEPNSSATGVVLPPQVTKEYGYFDIYAFVTSTGTGGAPNKGETIIHKRFWVIEKHKVSESTEPDVPLYSADDIESLVEGMERVAYVEYGVTEYEYITQLLADDKLPVIRYPDHWFIYRSIVDGKYTFVTVERRGTLVASVDSNNVWTHDHYDFYYTANYGSTTYATMTQMLEESRYCVAKRNGQFYQYRLKDSMDRYQFWAVDNSGTTGIILRKLILSTSGWTSQDITVSGGGSAEEYVVNLRGLFDSAGDGDVISVESDKSFSDIVRRLNIDEKMVSVIAHDEEESINVTGTIDYEPNEPKLSFHFPFKNEKWIISTDGSNNWTINKQSVHLYEHNITGEKSFGGYFIMRIVNTSPTAFTASNIVPWINSNGFNSNAYYFSTIFGDRTSNSSGDYKLRLSLGVSATTTVTTGLRSGIEFIEDYGVIMHNGIIASGGGPLERVIDKVRQII